MKFRHGSGARTLSLAAATLFTAGMMAIPAVANAATTTTQTTNWQIQVGAADPSNPTVQGFGYYPEVMTIDAGNTVTFSLGKGAEVHYVVFQDGASASATAPIAALTPGHSYGNGIVAPDSVNGAMLLPGYQYTLTFSTPGVYTYYCEVHGGQEGVIVVQPKGATLPYTAGQYQATAKQEIQQTLTAGDAAVGQAAVPTTVKNANGTTTYMVPAGLSPSQKVNTTLDNSAGMAVGSVSLSPTQTGLSVQGSFTGLSANTKYNMTLDNGILGHIQGPVTANSTITFTTNSSGSYTLSTSIANNPKSQTDLVPPMAGWVLSLNQGSTAVASANVTNNADASALAFVPQTLWIQPGDTVTWTEEGPQEAHTVTFLAPGQAEPANPFSPPAGGSVMSSDTYHNSGLLTYLDSYSLTFTKPGVYPYICMLHNDYGMHGTIVVEAAPTPPAPVHVPQVNGPTYFALLHHAIGQMGANLVPAQHWAATLYYTYHVLNDQSYVALLHGSGSASAQAIAQKLASTYHVTQ